jgi:peptidoglycan/LPS O-acetylase OafA/YrhL
MTGKWGEVAFMTVYWAGGMLVWAAMAKERGSAQRIWSAPNVLAALLLGLVYGLGFTFRRDAFHWPVAGIIVACFVGALAVMAAAKGEDRKAE